MARKYSMELLRAIKDKEYIVNERGLDILIKPIPDSDEDGIMYPRLYT